MSEIIQFPGSEEDRNITRINSVTSFAQLADALDVVSPVKGSQGLYSADELLDIVNRVRAGSLEITYVTSTFGLRQKVAELLESDASPVPEEEAVGKPNNFSHLEGKNWIDFRELAGEQKTIRRLVSMINHDENLKRGERTFKLGQLETFLDSNESEELFLSGLNNSYSLVQEKIKEITEAEIPQDSTDRLDRQYKIQRLEEDLQSLEDIINNQDGKLDAVNAMLYGS
jgi:hypothetical protein